ncbi:MAG: MBL fold metallo-hydrolase [Anaerolineales bacterium]|nr:MBL fold metallo-hydrolase [Anaerolineales bacterium]
MNTQLKTHPLETSFFAARGQTLVTWLGMAGVLLNVRGTILLIDPLISTIARDGELVSEEGYRLKLPLPIQAKDLPRADLVMYTHADDDHFGRVTAKTLAERLPCRFLAPPPIVQRLVEMGIAHERITTAVEKDVVQIGSAQVVITPALHDWQEVNPWKREDCCGYLVKTPDGTVWHPGDTRLIDDLLAFKDVDVMFFDVAAVDSHLGPQGSARLAQSCGAKLLVAYHYGTFDLPLGSFGNCDPDDALPFVKDIAGIFIKPNIGETLALPLE